MLDVIARRDNLKVLYGDVGNAFVTAPCLEKVYSRAGPEFGDRHDSIMVLTKALYGLQSSSRAFRGHFADFLHSMGFHSVRYDCDIWMQMREDKTRYDYICTHVDDFKIVARDPYHWLTQISGVFLLKSTGPPSYYLGNNYVWSTSENAWVLGCSTYIKECIHHLEEDDMIEGRLWEHKNPLPAEVHPELDESPLLDDQGLKLYQTLIGMAQWACTIGCLDISFTVLSLSRFSAAPHAGHLQLAIFMFGYLKKHPNRNLVIDSGPLIVPEEFKSSTFHPDFSEDYPDAQEELSPTMLEAFGSELETSIFFDADHAHNQKTHRSISGIIQFVGCTPVLWSSRHQGCIATSTYCAEFVAMCQAVEEAISLHYMLRCLGMPVTNPTNLYGDNFGLIQSASIPDSELKKKHVTISYHVVRESIAAKIVNTIWVPTHTNFADVCIRALGPMAYNALVSELMTH